MRNDNTKNQLQVVAEKMRIEGMPDIAISNFINHYQQLLENNTGFIPEASIQAIDKLPDAPGELTGR